MSTFENDCATCGRTGAELPVRIVILRKGGGEYDVISTWNHENPIDYSSPNEPRDSRHDISVVDRLTFDEMLGHVAAQTMPGREKRARLFGDSRRLPGIAAQALIDKGIA